MKHDWHTVYYWPVIVNLGCYIYTLDNNALHLHFIAHHTTNPTYLSTYSLFIDK